MIIDRIIELRDGLEDLDNNTIKYIYNMATMHDMQDIARSIDLEDNKALQTALKNYIVRNQYDIENGQLCKFVDCVDFFGNALKNDLDQAKESLTIYANKLYDIGLLFSSSLDECKFVAINEYIDKIFEGFEDLKKTILK